MNKIMIVDDEDDLRSVIREVFEDEGLTVLEARDGDSAIEIFKRDTPDAVLMDLSMPGMSGMETMIELAKINAGVPVIILTAHGDIPTAVEAIKSGAYDFTVKPPDFGKLIVTMRRAIEKRDLEMEVKKATDALDLSLEHLLGKSREMKQVIKQINQVAQTNYSIIIQGETGSGKTVVANAIHDMSRRAGKPFVRVDIGLIPDTLVESELFGYKKGAFTGAERPKPGYFEAAHGGTIFLDELENISPHVQGKLLSVIERKEIYPLGTTEPMNVDVRVVAATNKLIKEIVNTGGFREDLFYRLGEFTITLPPLRERTADIPFFAQKFMLESSTELNRQIRVIDPEAVGFLQRQPWPGNIRELKNVIRRAVLTAEGDCIRMKHLEALVKEQRAEGGSTCSLKQAVRKLEKQKIRETLIYTKGNKSKAAETLKMSYKSFSEKIKEYNIE